MLATVGIWLVVTTVYAYTYVNHRIHLSGAEGYERLWNWQLFFFSVTRLPILLLILAAILLVERRFLSR